MNVTAADFLISIKNLTCKSEVVPVFHKHHTMVYMGVEIYLLAFVTSALNGGEWSALSPEKSPLYSLDKRLGRCQNNKNSGTVTWQFLI
jgi:hypothetical protein